MKKDCRYHQLEIKEPKNEVDDADNFSQRYAANKSQSREFAYP